MKKLRSISTGWLIVLVVLMIPTVFIPPAQLQSRTASVYFDDSGANIILGAADYEVVFRKRDGGIVYIQDKTSSGRVSEGSLNGCLWVIVFDYNVPDYIESCKFTPEGKNRFSYVWSATGNQLVLHYEPDPQEDKQVAVTVTVTASTANWFDLQLSVENRWGPDPEAIKFPSDLTFKRTTIEEALLPILPGVILESGFFNWDTIEDKRYEAEYPGTMAADFVAIKSTNGSLAMYSISDPDQVVPARLGFYFPHCTDSSSICFTHNFRSGVQYGDRWLSPLVRIRLGEAYIDTIRAFRDDNGIADYPSIENKLGSLYQQVTRLPLYKADIYGIPFARLPGLLGNQIPYPGLLHLVAYWQRGFDENYPDFLPPDPSLGTTAEMVAMMRTVQDMGYLVMPYINPTWWDDESPTVRTQLPPLTIKDIAVLDRGGEPRYENYGSHHGFVVSPHSPFVQERLQHLMTSMTITIPSDLIHEDQIGGRASHPDFNPAAPHSAAYAQGWLEHTRQYRNLLLTCEMGYDRLAETETGFHGSVLLAKAEGKTSEWWGNTNWHLYPFAPLLLRDKVLLYHNTERRAATQEKPVLSMNLGMGYMLSFDWTAPESDQTWLNTVGAFQRYVLSEYANQQIADYRYLDDRVTQTRFENITVIVNWHEADSFMYGEFETPPLGAIVISDDGNLTAGIFKQYNGARLSQGDHYLIESRLEDQIVIRQTLGNDTPLALRLLPNWSSDTPLGVWAKDLTGTVIGHVPASISRDKIVFMYRNQLSGQEVDHFSISPTFSSYLPVSLRAAGHTSIYEAWMR